MDMEQLFNSLDYDKALKGEYEDKGLFPITKIQYLYGLGHSSKDFNIDGYKTILDEYYKQKNINIIDLVFINKDEEYWTFIEHYEFEEEEDEDVIYIEADDPILTPTPQGNQD